MADPTESFLGDRSLLDCVGTIGLPGSRYVYPKALLQRPLFVSRAHLDGITDDLRALLSLLESVPGRCFGGSTRRYLEAQGWAADFVTMMELGCLGETTLYGRADVLDTADGPRVIEFNLGSELGGLYSGVINRSLLRQKVFRHFADEHELSYVDPAQALAGQLRAAAASVVGVEDPVVAIVEETGSGGTCRLLADVLKDCGLRVVLGELDQITSSHGKIALTGQGPVDVVLRYFFVEHLLAEADGMRKLDLLMRAHRTGRTALFTTLDPQIHGSKAALALLFQPQVWSALSEAERSFVERVVPRTRFLDHEILDECLETRSSLVLKPAFGYASRGVHVGASTSDADWAAALRSSLAERHVVQEAVISRPEPIVDPESRAVEPWLVNWGVFVGEAGYGGSFVRGIKQADGDVVGPPDGMSRMGCAFSHGR
jgi:hypothetical protein